MSSSSSLGKQGLLRQGLRRVGGGWGPSRAMSSTSVTELGAASVVAPQTGLSGEGKGVYNVWTMKEWYKVIFF